jgi:hypothetical protein
MSSGIVARLIQSKPERVTSQLNAISGDIIVAFIKKLALWSALSVATSQGFGLQEASADQNGSAMIKATFQSTPFSRNLNLSPGVVDGQSYRRVFKSDIEVPAGNHIVNVNIDIKFSFNEMSYVDSIPFRAKLIPDHVYETRGRMSGRNVQIWIADTATNKLASKVLSITVERCFFRLTCKPAELKIKSRL